MVPTLSETEKERMAETIIRQQALNPGMQIEKKQKNKTIIHKHSAHGVNVPTKPFLSSGRAAAGGGVTEQFQFPAAIKMRHDKIYHLIGAGNLN